MCEVPEIGKKFDQFDAISSLDSSKTVSEVLTPFSGKIIAVNKKLEENPELINEDPYGDGWIAIIECQDFISEKEDLMTPDQYFEFLKEKVEQEGLNY